MCHCHWHSVKKLRNAITFFSLDIQNRQWWRGVLHNIERELSKLNLCLPISLNGQAQPNMISKVVLARWWWVNMAAQHLKYNWDQRQAIAQAALNNTTANTAAGKIASSILSVMPEKKLGCGLHFIAGFWKSYFVKHMTSWLQCIDERSGDFSYLSHQMPA
jgi:hypothetical protein